MTDPTPAILPERMSREWGVDDVVTVHYSGVVKSVGEEGASIRWCWPDGGVARSSFVPREAITLGVIFDATDATITALRERVTELEAALKHANTAHLVLTDGWPSFYCEICRTDWRNCAARAVLGEDPK